MRRASDASPLARASRPSAKSVITATTQSANAAPPIPPAASASTQAKTGARRIRSQVQASAQILMERSSETHATLTRASSVEIEPCLIGELAAPQPFEDTWIEADDCSLDVLGRVADIEPPDTGDEGGERGEGLGILADRRATDIERR